MAVRLVETRRQAEIVKTASVKCSKVSFLSSHARTRESSVSDSDQDQEIIWSAPVNRIRLDFSLVHRFYYLPFVDGTRAAKVAMRAIARSMRSNVRVMFFPTCRS
jgi:hypothetical protein